MTDTEYIQRLGIIYQEVLKLRKNDHYRINQTQMDKFVKVLDFFMKHTIEDDYVEPVNIAPEELHGGVTAVFVVFDVSGQEVQEFCNVMRDCSAISIDSLEDGRICISCTIPDVFVPVKVQ